MLTKEEKKTIVKKHGKKADNTGSAAVQIALLTSKITYLTEHFKTHKKDFAAQKNLLFLVGKRKKFLRYLQNRSQQEYSDLISELKIRK